MEEPQLSSAEIIQGWKDTYGEVYSIHILGIDFYFRLLPYQEYASLMNLAQDQFALDELLVDACLLDPQIDDISGDIYAGFVTTIARAIKEESLIIPKDGETFDIKQQIEEAEQHIERDFREQMPLIICRAFSQYRIEEVKQWPFNEQVTMTAQAFWTLRNIDSIDLGFEDDT